MTEVSWPGWQMFKFGAPAPTQSGHDESLALPFFLTWFLLHPFLSLRFR